MNFSQEQRDFLKDFFKENIELIREKDMLEPDDIKMFADLYRDYLKNSKFREDDILKYFLFELKQSQYYETLIKNGKIKLTLNEKMLRKSILISSHSNKCKNEVIKKWFNESKIIKIVNRTETNNLNKSIEPKIKQNAKELRLSWESCHNKWIR